MSSEGVGVVRKLEVSSDENDVVNVNEISLEEVKVANRWERSRDAACN